MRFLPTALALMTLGGLFTACTPQLNRTDAGPMLRLPPAPAGALVDSRLAFGLRYPADTTTPGPDATLDRTLQDSLEGTRYTCIAGRTEHAVFPDAGSYAGIDERLRTIGYTVTPIKADTYLISRDFDVIAAHAHGNTLSLCETRW